LPVSLCYPACIETESEPAWSGWG